MCLVICFGGANNSERVRNSRCALCETPSRYVCMCVCGYRVSYISHTCPNVNAFPHSRWYVVCITLQVWYYYFTRALSSILFIKMHLHNSHIPKQPFSISVVSASTVCTHISTYPIAIQSPVSKLFASMTVSYCYYCLNFRFWLFFFLFERSVFFLILLGVYGETFRIWENVYEAGMKSAV